MLDHTDTPPVSDDLDRALEEIDSLQGRLDRPSLERQRILSHALLQQVDRDVTPKLWAALQGTLGNAASFLFEIINEATFAVEAEVAYHRALEVYTQDASPFDWAMTQNNLAGLYLRMYERTGEARYARQAEDAFRRALKVYTKEATSSEWAMTQTNLANLYARMYERTGEVHYFQQAQQAFFRALEAYAREARSSDWGATQNNLANLYHNLYERTGEERYAQWAEEAFQRALEVYTREASPFDWADTQNNLATLYLDLYKRTGEERYAQWAEEAILRALEVYSKDDSPTDWAMAQNNLANLYLQMYRRTGEERYAHRLEEAFHRALEVYTQEASPIQWAMTQNSLANLYLDLYKRTGQTHYAYQAKVSYQRALEVYTPNANPSHWAMTQNNLANLYLDLYERTGETSYAQLAERALLRAVEVYTQDASPFDWAMAQNNLAGLYLRMYERTGKTRYAHRAEEAYRRALEVYSREASLPDWAMTQNNLANLYLRMYERTGEARYAHLAEDVYHCTLEVYTRKISPSDWGMIQNNLAGLYLRLYERRGQERYAHLAEESYHHALEVYARETSPPQWATTQNNLGLLYAALYARTDEEDHARQAEDAYRLTLEVYDPRVAPVDALRTARSLARLYARQARWAEAHEAYTTALTAANTRYLAAAGDRERRVVMAEAASLFHEDARALLHQGRPWDALARLEEGHARALRESMGLETLARERHSDKGVQRLRAAQRRVREADARLAATQHAVDTAPTEAARQEALTARAAALQDLIAAREALEALVKEMGLEPPTISADDLATLPLAPDTAAVAFLLTDDEGTALILYNGEITPVPLSDFTREQVMHLGYHRPEQVKGWIDAYNARFETNRRLHQARAQGEDAQGAEQALKEARARWQAALEAIAATQGNYEAGWYYAYRLAFHVVHGEGNRQAERAALNAWKRTVERTVEELARRFWQPVAAHLPSTVKRIILLPAGLATLLPLHAAAADAGLQNVVVAYAPSLLVWQQARAQAQGRAASSLFLSTPATDLPFTKAEAEWLKARFQNLGRPVLHLDKNQATAQAVRERAQGHGVVHFSGHAFYNWNDPGASGLRCAGGILTLRETRQGMDLSAARVVTLSACETGVSDVMTGGEEFFGLPGGLLDAGAPAVVASLWPVHDVSTAFLMDRFYELWLEKGYPIAWALQEAATWLRKATKADLLRCIQESTDDPQARAELESMLEAAIQVESARMAAREALDAASQILRKPDFMPFQSPHYWAAFAAYGAVLESDGGA